VAPEKYDFVIIGSGMGGLTCAVILTKRGYRVLVLEKNHQIGGALQVFSRDKCIFDTGVHYLGGLDEGENLYYFFKYLGIYDRLKLQSLNRDCFDLIRLADGSTYKHAQGYESFAKTLTEAFPEEAAAIENFCQKIQEICIHFPLYNLEDPGDNPYYENSELLSIGAWDYICSITNNERLRNVLLGSSALYAGEAKTTPLFVVALIMNSYIKGSYRLVDGGSQIAKELSKQIRAKGGTILKHKNVVGARYNDDGALVAVNCSDGSSYEATNFISNLHPASTLSIFGPEKFISAYRSRISRLENTVSTFMVYISLQGQFIPYLNYNIYEHFTEDTWNATEYNEADWPQLMYVYTPASSKSSVYAESICAMCYMSIEEVRKWENTFNTVANPEERGAAYRKFKEEKQERVIQRLESRFPDLRKAIRGVHSSSPLTYKDYIGSPDGSLYGIKKDFKDPVSTIIYSKTRIRNLYLTGQNVVFHGILGTTISGFVTCLNFINFRELIDEMKSYGK